MHRLQSKRPSEPKIVELRFGWYMTIHFLILRLDASFISLGRLPTSSHNDTGTHHGTHALEHGWCDGILPTHRHPVIIRNVDNNPNNKRKVAHHNSL
jgi:hypothetical protein